jgi:hypothetical protein
MLGMYIIRHELAYSTTDNYTDEITATFIDKKQLKQLKQLNQYNQYISKYHGFTKKN